MRGHFGAPWCALGFLHLNDCARSKSLPSPLGAGRAGWRKALRLEFVHLNDPVRRKFLPSPPWGRGWTATRAFTGGGGTGEGVSTRAMGADHFGWKNRGLILDSQSWSSRRGFRFSRPPSSISTSALSVRVLDPLTRLAPADEHAGRKPPSPPRGRGERI